MAGKKKFDRGSYGGKGGHGKAHDFGGVIRETSIGALRQQVGDSYFPAPPRGFRPGDEGKDVFPNRGERGSRG